MKRWGFLAATSALVTIASANQAAAAAAVPAQTVDGGATRAERAATQKAAREERKAARRRARAVRQAQKEGADTATYRDSDGADIIVTGIRGSVASAQNRKRNSKQIVDAVVSEDVGKLPDNNVPEALSRIPGVQISRERGEGGNVTIRGLSDIQTTVNGAEVGGAGERSINLSDIPAELLKSVEVYKTRSANQIEGGIAGTVNVELRRPLDLPKGLTLAGSARLSMGDIGKTKSPYYSGLAAYRFETGIGEMGFLANVSWTRTQYNENYVVNESPNNIFRRDPPNNPSPEYTSLSYDPVLRDKLILPFAINYGVERGFVKRPSVNLSYQWRPSPQLNFVLEGAYFGSHERGERPRLSVVTNDENNFFTNVTANPDGTARTVEFYVLDDRNGVKRRVLNGGAFNTFIDGRGDNYHTNFETHWNGGIARIDLGVQYDWSSYENYSVSVNGRIRNPTVARVDFDSPVVPGGGPFVTFPGVNIADPNQINLFQIHDDRFEQNSSQFAANVDLTLNTSNTGFFRTLQTGYRYTNNNRDNRFGYRDAFWFDPAQQPTLAAVSAATAIPTGLVTPSVRGASGSTPTWTVLRGGPALDSFDALRRYALANGVDTVGNDYSTVRPTFQDLGSAYTENEQSFAAYAQINYGLKLKFPIDGQLGIRYFNTWGNSTSQSYRFELGPDGKLPKDEKGRNIYNFQTFPVSAGGNYDGINYNASAIVHFADKLQLRLSYNRNIQRPGFADLRPWLELRDAIADPVNGPVYRGNPNLKPIVDNNFSASLECYFGRAGQISIAPFYKRQDGFIYFTFQPEYVPELGRVVNRVGKVRNAGPGKVAGVEGNVTTFFDFLGGFARNFGTSANATWIPSSSLELFPKDEAPEVPGVFDSPFTSRFSGNLQLYYDTPRLSARVAYNFRSKYKTGIDYANPGYSIYSGATRRLDAAINYTPVKYTTFSVEATNLTKSYDPAYYGAFDALPVGVRVAARTIQVSVRMRR